MGDPPAARVMLADWVVTTVFVICGGGVGKHKREVGEQERGVRVKRGLGLGGVGEEGRGERGRAGEGKGWMGGERKQGSTDRAPDGPAG